MKLIPGRREAVGDAMARFQIKSEILFFEK
jgi:hypothetical protein